MLDFTEISSNILSMDELSLSETDRLAFSTIYCFDKSARDLIELMKKVLMENINHFKENCRIFLDEIISNLAKDEGINLYKHCHKVILKRRAKSYLKNTFYWKAIKIV